MSDIAQNKVIGAVRRANDLPYEYPPVQGQYTRITQGGPAVIAKWGGIINSGDTPHLDVAIRMKVELVNRPEDITHATFLNSTIKPCNFEISQDLIIEEVTPDNGYFTLFWPVGVFKKVSGVELHCGELYWAESISGGSWQGGDAYSTSKFWSDNGTAAPAHPAFFRFFTPTPTPYTVYSNKVVVVNGTHTTTSVYGADNFQRRLCADTRHKNDRFISLPALYLDNPIMFVFDSTNYVRWFSPDGSSKTLNIPNNTDATVYYQIKADQLSLSATADGSSGQDIELAEVKTDSSGYLTKWHVHRYPVERLRNTMTVVVDVSGAGVTPTYRDLYDFGCGRRYDEY